MTAALHFFCIEAGNRKFAFVQRSVSLLRLYFLKVVSSSDSVYFLMFHCLSQEPGPVNASDQHQSDQD